MIEAQKERREVCFPSLPSVVSSSLRPARSNAQDASSEFKRGTFEPLTWLRTRF